MGLLDILNGMQNGPGGQRQAAPASSGGMSPMMMALLGLLAYKAIKGGGLENMLRGAGGQPQAPMNPGGGLGGGSAGGPGGGLGDILGGLLGGGAAGRSSGGLGDILGGALSGGAASGGLGNVLGGLLGGNAGGALNGGLRNLIGEMEENGQGNAARSWVGTGANHAIAPDDLASALGTEDIDAVAHQTGLPREQLLAQLSQHLPEFVNQLTPDGRLPTDHEANARW
jgi:uncharacterized protein YidB (DUF937 family)